MLLSNVLPRIIENYDMKTLESTEGFEKVIDNVEKAYINGQIGELEYRRALNELGGYAEGRKGGE